MSCSSSRPRRSAGPSLAAQVAALDEGDRVSEICEREAVGEAGSVCALGGIGSSHELARGVPPQATSSPELLDAGHAAGE